MHNYQIQRLMMRDANRMVWTIKLRGQQSGSDKRGGYRHLFIIMERGIPWFWMLQANRIQPLTGKTCINKEFFYSLKLIGGIRWMKTQYQFLWHNHLALVRGEDWDRVNWKLILPKNRFQQLTGKTCINIEIYSKKSLPLTLAIVDWC